MDTTEYRWILYVQINGIPSGPPDPERFGSLAEVRDHVEQFQMDHNHTDVTGFLYGYGPEEWETAQEFAGIGTPFDYPAKVAEVGPRGGITIRNA